MNLVSKKKKKTLMNRVNKYRNMTYDLFIDVA